MRIFVVGSEIITLLTGEKRNGGFFDNFSVLSLSIKLMRIPVFLPPDDDENSPPA